MQGPSPLPPVFVACAFKDQAAIEGVVRELRALGLRGDDIGVGGLGPNSERARALAAELGIRPDIDPEDPLAGAPGLASAGSGAASIDRGATIGGVAGAVAGFIFGIIPGTQFLATDPRFAIIADILLFFILGALAGATLGGALAPQRSSHAGFRIVDELEHGGLALVATADADRAAAVTTSLAAAGGLHVQRVPSE